MQPLCPESKHARRRVRLRAQKDAQDFAREAGGTAGRVTMYKTKSRSIALAVAALWSLPASAGDLPPGSVYVAPGGVYIGSAQVYVGPGNGNGNGQAPYVVPGRAYVPGPAYVPGYGLRRRRPTRRKPTVRNTVCPAELMRRPMHPHPCTERRRSRSMVQGRPLGPTCRLMRQNTHRGRRQPVPYNGGRRCVVAYGRMICD